MEDKDNRIKGMTEEEIIKGHPECFKCGKKAHFWLDLGDFVVGTKAIQPVCLDCIDFVMSKCVYQSSKWKHRIRFWDISTNEFIFDSDVLKKVEEKVNAEFRRAYPNFNM